MFSLVIISTLSKEIKTYDDFLTSCNHFGIEVNNSQLETFKKYSEILIEWNAKINLVSRNLLNDEDRRLNFLLEKCYLDSLMFLPEIEGLLSLSSTPYKILDIGSGAGFPAVPLTIVNSDIKVTLCESIRKKADFLKSLTDELKLDITVINNRVENIKQKYDLVTARAVTNIEQLINYSYQRLERGGHLVIYKAKDIDEELNNAEALIDRKNLTMEIVSKVINDVERKLVVLKK